MTRLKTSHHVWISNRLTGEREFVDVVREFDAEIPTDEPYSPDTFHAIEWTDQETLDAYFRRRR